MLTTVLSASLPQQVVVNQSPALSPWSLSELWNCTGLLNQVVCELDLQYGDHISANPSSAENIHWLVPRSASPFLIGRAKITSNVIGSISPILDETPACQKRFILTGIGGQGKSEICLNVVNQVRSLCVTRILVLFR